VKRNFSTIVFGASLACLYSAALSQGAGRPEPENPQGCLRCHRGIESIREEGSIMLRQILSMGKAAGDPAGCVVCHGGDPSAQTKEAAHGGKAFWPDPGSPWINAKTCGTCHEEHVRVQWHSLMMTEAGKIQGVAWTFGAMTGYEHKWGNYEVSNPSDPKKRLGSEAYRKYMQRLKEAEPQVFVDKHEALPPAPTDPAELKKNPRKAAFTYLRNQCLRCHHAVRGRQKRGDWRGMGCSSCHVPYSNEGRYEGKDLSIPRDEPGHMLVHTIQATREAKVTVNGITYSGIPVETCTTCHDRGKRIGVSFQGLMEIPYQSPYRADGSGQPALHTKHYLAMHQDLHYGKGMLCQDCHTTLDVHSDGFLAAANLGAVEIECTDCHGTPWAYPWELPLGYGDEFLAVPADAPPRGTSKQLPPMLRQGTAYPAGEGYLLSARGNVMGNVVRKGNLVVVHTAGGKDLELKPLKTLSLAQALHHGGAVAMVGVKRHIDTMECYSCHASWAPQCYGCHVKIDYSRGKRSFDWLAAGHLHRQAKHASDRGERNYKTYCAGEVHEERSFTRWEDPMLGVNGEGRITPIAPGCQPSITVIGKEGEPILVNHIFRTPAGLESGGKSGQRTIDISPTQPHTMTTEARSCESCHVSRKALGYGIGGGTMTRPASEGLVVDIETAQKVLLPKVFKAQCEPIKGLPMDWSRVVTEEGEQLQTVGHHFKKSRPLNNEERHRTERSGVCLACHKKIPSGSLAVSLLHHVARVTGSAPRTATEHGSLLNKILLTAAWTQAALPVLLLVCGAGLLFLFMRRRAKKRSMPP